MKTRHGFISNSSTTNFVCVSCKNLYTNTDGQVSDMEMDCKDQCPWCLKREKAALCLICAKKYPTNSIINIIYVDNNKVLKIFDVESFDPDGDSNGDYGFGFVCPKCFMTDDICIYDRNKLFERLKDPNCHITEDEKKIVALISSTQKKRRSKKCKCV